MSLHGFIDVLFTAEMPFLYVSVMPNLYQGLNLVSFTIDFILFNFVLGTKHDTLRVYFWLAIQGTLLIVLKLTIYSDRN